MLEQIRLPFWYDGHQYDIARRRLRPVRPQPAGRRDRRDLLRHPAGRRAGWGSTPPRCASTSPTGSAASSTRPAVAQHPIRQAVIEAALITQQQPAGHALAVLPAGRRPRVQGGDGARTRRSPRGPPTPSTRPSSRSPPSAKLRDRETSRRWQAHYDLIRGRLLAMKIRCYEYNWACAKMKKDAPKFTEARVERLEARPRRRRSTTATRPPPPASEARDLLEARRRRAPQHPLGPARPARAEGPVRLQVGRDLRPADRPQQQRRRGRGQEEGQDEERCPSRRSRPSFDLSGCGRSRPPCQGVLVSDASLGCHEFRLRTRGQYSTSVRSSPRLRERWRIARSRGLLRSAPRPMA